MFRGAWDRELGARLRARSLGSCDLAQRLELQHRLEGHEGCVNTCSFSPNGETLVSGSDDTSIIFWDWDANRMRLRYDSGHVDNIFQARILPHSADRTVVSCAADGQVRLGAIKEDGRVATRQLARHRGRAHKLALDPLHPACFYSSGEDGAVLYFDTREAPRTSHAARPLLSITTRGGSAENAVRGWRAAAAQREFPLEVNAITVNPARPWQLAVGGGDQHVRVYDHRRAGGASAGASAAGSDASRVSGEPVARLCPSHLARGSPGRVCVTCVVFSRQGELLASYNDEDAYLFAVPGQETSSGSGQRQRDGSHASNAGLGDSCDEDGGDLPAPSRAERRRAAAARRRAPAGDDDRAGSWDDEDGGSAGTSGRGSRNRRGGRGSRGSHGDASRGADGSRRRDGGSDGSEGSDGGDGTAGQAADDHVLRRYSGHRNRRTIKGINFLGPNDECVVSGSDCGHVFIWSKATGDLLAWHKGDADVVNVLEPHPHLPYTLATSGTPLAL